MSGWDAVKNEKGSWKLKKLSTAGVVSCFVENVSSNTLEASNIKGIFGWL